MQAYVELNWEPHESKDEDVEIGGREGLEPKSLVRSSLRSELTYDT